MEEPEPQLKVSAVIVSWNSAITLRRCLESLERSHNRENLEIIVVDSGSRDESPQLDSEYPKVNLLRLPRNFGLVKALNIGMRTATGSVFLFLRPEMEVLPETVASLAARLEASPEAAAVCPMLVTPGGEPVSRIRRLPSPKELYRAWRDGDFPDWSIPDTHGDCLAVEYLKPLAIMVRANFLRGMRYIDERYGNSWWDLEVCHQIRRGAKKILLLPEVRVIIHPWEDFTESLPAGARALFSADSAMCAATFAGKHYGLGAGLKLRFSAAMRAFLEALLALVRLRDAGYHFSRFNYLLGGQKLDGSQRIF